MWFPILPQKWADHGERSWSIFGLCLHLVYNLGRKKDSKRGKEVLFPSFWPYIRSQVIYKSVTETRFITFLDCHSSTFITEPPTTNGKGLKQLKIQFHQLPPSFQFFNPSIPFPLFPQMYQILLFFFSFYSILLFLWTLIYSLVPNGSLILSLFHLGLQKGHLFMVINGKAVL